MPTIKGTVTTESTFKDKGAQKGLKNLEQSYNRLESGGVRLGREQTRLGQQSASAGRQFGAQAKGLGGLVGVYAAAAANVFALQQAFSALATAARFEQTIQGTRTLATTIGESGDSIISKVQEITKGQINLKETAENTNIALSAGFDATQIERLVSVAQKASRALGRDLTDSINRLTRGTAKLEPELLDEIGIFTRIEPALLKYTVATGKSVESLTQFERRQAFVNAAIEEGERKFGDINVASRSSQASLERLVSSLTDLALKFGTVVVDAVAPLADFFSDNLGNQITLFGGILALVFGKLLQILGQAIPAGIEKFSLGLEKFITKIVTLRQSTDQLAQSARITSKAFTSAADIADSISKKGLGNVGGAAFKVDRQIVNEGINALKSLTAETKLSTSELLKRIDVVRESIIANNRVIGSQKAGAASIDKLNQVGNKLQGGLDNLLRAYKAQNAAVIKVGESMKRFTAFTSRAAAVVGKFLSALQTVAAVIGLAQFFFSFFDVDIIGEITKAIGSLVEESKKLKAAIEELVATNDDVKFFAQALAGLTEEKDISKFIQSIATELPNVLRRAAVEAGKAAQNTDGLLSNIFDFSDQDTAFKNAFKDLNAIQEAALKDLNRQVVEFNAQGRLEDEARVRSLIALISDTTAVFAKLTVDVNRLTGASVKDVGKLINDGNLTVNTLQEVVLAFGDSTVVLGKFEEQQAKLSNTTGIVGAGLINLKTILAATNKEFVSGSQSAEKAETRVGALTKTYEKAVSDLDKLRAANKLTTKEQEEFTKALAEGKKEIDIYAKLANELKDIEQLQRDINSQFSSQIKLAGTLASSGLFDIQGKLATSSRQVAVNQLDILTNLVKQGEAAKELLDEEDLGRESASKLNKQVELGSQAMAALTGNVVQAVKGFESLNDSLTDSNKKLEEQIDIAIRRNQLLDIQNELDVQNALLNIQNIILERNVNSLRTRVDILNIEIDLAQKRADAEKTTIEAGIARLEREREILKVTSEINSLRLKESGRSEIFGREQILESAKRFKGLFSETDLQQQTLKITLADTESQIKVLDLRKEIIEKDAAAQLDIIERRQTLFEAELENAGIIATNRSEAIEAQREVDLAAIQQREINLIEQRKLIDLESKISLQNLEIQRVQAKTSIETQKIQLERQIRDIELQKKQIETFNNFVEGLNTFVINLENVLRKTSLFQGTKPVELKTIVKTGTEELDKVSGKFAEMQSNLTKLFGTQEEGFKKQEEQIKRSAELRKQAANESIKSLINERDAINKKANLQQEILDTETQTTLVNINEKIEVLNAEKELIERNKNLALEQNKAQIRSTLETRAAADLLFADFHNQFVHLMDDIALVLNDKLGSSIQDLTQAIIQGTLTLDNFKEGLKDFFNNVLLGIGEKVTQRFIIDPITNLISDAFKKGGKKPDGTKDNAFYIKFADEKVAEAFKSLSKESQNFITGIDPESIVGDIPESSLSDILDMADTEKKLEESMQKGFFDKLKDGLSSLFGGKDSFFGGILSEAGKLLSGVFGSEGILSNLLSGLIKAIGGGSSGGLGAAIKSFFAGGGVAKFVGGGNVSSRDRVPAMLEPGEVVVSRGTLRKMQSGGLLNELFKSEGLGAIGSLSARRSGIGAIRDVTTGPSGEILNSQTTLFGNTTGSTVAEASVSKNTGVLSGLSASDTIGLVTDEAPDGDVIGGLIRKKMVGGGRSLRDRIPTLLEPGEFVVRKSAVRSVGVPALQNINRGGSGAQKSVSPNVQVNVVNQGTPQQNEGTPNVRIDGDKMVVDIVLRDFRQNGPIRRSLRGLG